MYVVFMGPPGAGKGTQAEGIVTEFGIPHISTGDAFRTAMKAATPMGILAKQYVDQGLLVPDDVTNGIVQERLTQPDTIQGALLDGYPRTVAQAEVLEGILQEFGKELNYVVYLEVDANKLLARLTGRRICKSCGATFHLEFNPTLNEGICDKCGGELYQRSDDTVEKVGTRLDEYFSKTAPVLQFYANKGLLFKVNGDDSIDQVSHRIFSILRGGE